MTISSPDALLERLHNLGQGNDESLPLAETALMLAALDRSGGIDLEPYREHLARVAGDARDSFASLRRGMTVNDAAARALVDIISSRHGYMGDSTNYDDPRRFAEPAGRYEDEDANATPPPETE